MTSIEKNSAVNLLWDYLSDKDQQIYKASSATKDAWLVDRHIQLLSV